MSNAHGCATITAVTPGSAAQRAGMRAGDTLLAVNGRRLQDNDPYSHAIELLAEASKSSKPMVLIVKPSLEGGTRPASVESAERRRTPGSGSSGASRKSAASQRSGLRASPLAAKSLASGEERAPLQTRNGQAASRIQPQTDNRAVAVAHPVQHMWSPPATSPTLLHTTAATTPPGQRIVNIMLAGGKLGVHLRGGAEFNQPLFIASTDPHSCAEQAGLRAGDRLTSINGVSCTNMTHAEAVAAIRGRNQLRLCVCAPAPMPVPAAPESASASAVFLSPLASPSGAATQSLGRNRGFLSSSIPKLSLALIDEATQQDTIGDGQQQQQQCAQPRSERASSRKSLRRRFSIFGSRKNRKASVEPAGVRSPSPHKQGGGRGRQAGPSFGRRHRQSRTLTSPGRTGPLASPHITSPAKASLARPGAPTLSSLMSLPPDTFSRQLSLAFEEAGETADDTVTDAMFEPRDGVARSPFKGSPPLRRSQRRAFQRQRRLAAQTAVPAAGPPAPARKAPPPPVQQNVTAPPTAPAPTAPQLYTNLESIAESVTDENSGGRKHIATAPNGRTKLVASSTEVTSMPSSSAPPPPPPPPRALFGTSADQTSKPSMPPSARPDGVTEQAMTTAQPASSGMFAELLAKAAQPRTVSDPLGERKPVPGEPAEDAPSSNPLMVELAKSLSKRRASTGADGVPFQASSRGCRDKENKNTCENTRRRTLSARPPPELPPVDYSPLPAPSERQPLCGPRTTMRLNSTVGPQTKAKAPCSQLTKIGSKLLVRPTPPPPPPSAPQPLLGRSTHATALDFTVAAAASAQSRVSATGDIVVVKPPLPPPRHDKPTLVASADDSFMLATGFDAEALPPPPASLLHTPMKAKQAQEDGDLKLPPPPPPPPPALPHMENDNAEQDDGPRGPPPPPPPAADKPRLQKTKPPPVAIKPPKKQPPLALRRVAVAPAGPLTPAKSMEHACTPTQSAPAAPPPPPPMPTFLRPAAPRLVSTAKSGSFASLTLTAARINQRAGSASPPRIRAPLDPRDALLSDIKKGNVALRPTQVIRDQSQGPSVDERDTLLMSVAHFDRRKLRAPPQRAQAAAPRDCLLSEIKGLGNAVGSSLQHLRHVDVDSAPRPPSPRSQLLAQVCRTANSGTLRPVQGLERSQVLNSAPKPLVSPHECMMMQIRKFQPSRLASASSSLRCPTLSRSPDRDLHAAFKDALSERFRGCHSPGQRSESGLNDTATFEDTTFNESWYDPASP